MTRSAYHNFVADFNEHVADLKKQNKYPKRTRSESGKAWEVWFVSLAFVDADWQKDLLKECRRMNKQLGIHSINKLNNTNGTKRWKKAKTN